MKKIIIISCLLLGFQFGAKAQVVIPDANFASFLQNNYPTCITGNVLDTICAEGIAGTLDCSIQNISDLTGIQYFQNLQTLTCSNNNLVSLPTLPNSITYLNCSGNYLTSLPVLPNSLLNLNFGTNQLTSMPALPNGLTSLFLDGNYISNLGILPNALQNLSCDGNLLTSLPTLPNTLVGLQCDNNLITSLPALPNSLTSLFCYNDSLTSLPRLPNSLGVLACYNNLLTSLPVLPSTLIALDCSYNNINCIPLMPNSLTNTLFFNISGNPFTCLPNYVAAMDSATLAYPLCITGDIANNPNNCGEVDGIIGYTFSDMDANCIHGTSDLSLQNVQVKIYDNTSTLIAQTISAMNGVYDFPVPTGTYTVMIDTLGMPFQVNCIYPGIDSTVVLTTASALQTNVNFSLTCKPGFDAGVQSVTEQGMVFPGQHHTLKVIAGDLSNWYNLHCAQGISGQVVISIVGPVTFDSVCTGALIPSIAGNVFTYNVADFGLTNLYSSFGLALTTNSNALNGDSITVNVTVTPTSGDNNTSNNTYNYYYHVVNSYDPNYKETYPEQVQPGFDDYFTYTVHFQNTGSAAAININLQDTLDANLDLNTFQVINYSHYNTTWLTGNKLSFNFPNIQLADSSTDFNGSQGFVQYRIKPLANLPAGTLIHNRASIYFDYNAPVLTNTTTNEFMLGVGVPSTIKASSISIFPNPSSGVFRIDAGNNKLKEIKVRDVLGRIVLVTNINSSNTTIDLSKETKGVYFIQLSDENNNRVNKKIIIE